MKTYFTSLLISCLGLVSCAATGDVIQKELQLANTKAFSTFQKSSRIELVDFEPLIGKWHLDLSSIPDSEKRWMKDNKISDFYVTFDWGTNKSWIDFDDYQVRDGEIVQTGKGFLAFDAGTEQIRFLEQGAEGAFIIGSMAQTSAQVFERRIEVFRDGGDVRNRIDIMSFTPSDDQCMQWQTIFAYNGTEEPSPPNKMCRKQGIGMAHTR